MACLVRLTTSSSECSTCIMRLEDGLGGSLSQLVTSYILRPGLSKVMESVGLSAAFESMASLLSLLASEFNSCVLPSVLQYSGAATDWSLGSLSV